MKTLTPKIPLTNPHFKYTPSAKTDIRDTFRKANKELKTLEPKKQS